MGAWLRMIRGVESNVADGSLADALSLARSRFKDSMAHANLFLLPKGEDCPASTAVGARLCECLRREFCLSTQAIMLPPMNEGGGAAEYLCLAIDSSQPERVRDAIKEHLWRTRHQTPAGSTFHDLLRGRHEKAGHEFLLEEYGMFLPSRTRKSAGIRTHSFEHRPAFYRYRLALARVDGLPGPMADYLHALFTNCPNHLFRETVFRASGAGRRGLGLEIPLTPVCDHDIIDLAGRSRSFRGVSSRHENLQKYFLEHDPATVACEVPVWMESWELTDYRRVLGTEAPLTGHIDVLRREEDGRLGVWDYKPHAAAERHAHLQVFLYAVMLALRTGLPLADFSCGYFDEKDAYLFGPTQARLARP
jgi:hypothetical protein